MIHSTYVTENSHQFQPQIQDEENPPSFYRRRKSSSSEDSTPKVRSKQTSRAPTVILDKPIEVQVLPPPAPAQPPKPQIKKNHFQFEKIGIRMGVDYSWRPFIPNIQPIPEPIVLDRPIYTQMVRDSSPRNDQPQDSSTPKDAPSRAAPAKVVPLPKKPEGFNKAACTIYKVAQCMRFFDERIKSAKSELRHDFYKEYYDNDANAFLDQSIELIKARIGLILDGIVEDEELDLSTDSDKLEINLGFIADEIVDICSAKDAGSFDNPLVLSFMANLCTHGSYLPHGAFTSWTISRLTFTSANQLRDPDENTCKLILGEYLICRVLCANILFNPEGHKPGEELSDQKKKNLQIIGSCFARSFENLVNELELEQPERGESLHGIPLQPRAELYTMGEVDDGFAKQEEFEEATEFVEVDPSESYKSFQEILPEEECQGADVEALKEKLGGALEALYKIALEQGTSEKGDDVKIRKEGKTIIAKVGGNSLDKKYIE